MRSIRATLLASWRLSLGQWQHARSLEGIAPEDISNIFEYIAYRMSDTLGIDSSITQSKLIEIIEQYLSEKGGPGDFRDPTIKLIQLIRGRTWVFTELGNSPEQTYGFALRGIQEYGAASWLVRSHLTADTLANEIVSKATKDSWHGIIELALAIYRDRHNNDDLISVIKEKELRDGGQSSFLEDLL